MVRNVLLAVLGLVTLCCSVAQAQNRNIQSNSGSCWVFRNGDSAIAIRVGNLLPGNKYAAKMAAYAFNETSLQYERVGDIKDVQVKEFNEGNRFRVQESGVGVIAWCSFYRGRSARGSDRVSLRIKPTTGGGGPGGGGTGGGGTGGGGTGGGGTGGGGTGGGGPAPSPAKGGTPSMQKVVQTLTTFTGPTKGCDAPPDDDMGEEEPEASGDVLPDELPE